MASVEDLVNDSVASLSKTLTVRFPGDLLIGIGDFHGYESAFNILMDGLHQEYTIFKNEKNQVLHDNVMLVFTGDYIDRGKGGLEIIKNLMRLTENNPSQVKTLFGNHEVMALADRDNAAAISKPGYVPYGVSLLGEYSRRTLHGVNGGGEFLMEFGEDEESAFANYVERMSKRGDIGKWMRNTLKPCFLAGFNDRKILFTHADIPEEIGTRNALLRFRENFSKHMAGSSTDLGGSLMKYSNEELFGSGSLFWDRRFEELNDSDVSGLVERLKTNYLVVGHTPHEEITVYGGKIFDIDVGMTPTKGENEPAALVFKPDGIHAFYPYQGETLLRKL